MVCENVHTYTTIWKLGLHLLQGQSHTSGQGCAQVTCEASEKNGPCIMKHLGPLVSARDRNVNEKKVS